MKQHIMIDLETLGTNIDSQILSIGACAFGPDGIGSSFYQAIELPRDEHVNATPGTIAFWISQGEDAFNSLFDTCQDSGCLSVALGQLSAWLNSLSGENVIWANGTKFDLGMLEYQYKKIRSGLIPWSHNSDRCMRTLRAYAGRMTIDFDGVSHHALDDAKWQALYVIKAHDVLGLEWE